ncbi:MAG: CvpA family protein, partial [Bacteroidales bacterium]|nr:CvpA family protein [Bacteroidales bacterium]
KFSDVAGVWLGNYLKVSQTLLNILSFALVLAAVLLITLFFAKLLTAAVENISLGWLNKVLGLVSAIATSAVIIGLIIILFDTINAKFGLVKSPVLQESLLYGALKDFGYFVFPYMKQLLSLAS